MAIRDSLLSTLEFLINHDIDCGELYIYSNIVSLSVFDSRNLPAKSRRKLKRAFGKLTASGSPPYVTLSSERQEIGDGITIKLDMHGAFECKVIGETEELVEIPAVPATPARIETKKKFQWSCEAASATGEDF